MVPSLVFYDELLLRYDCFTSAPHPFKSRNGLPPLLNVNGGVRIPFSPSMPSI